MNQIDKGSDVADRSGTVLTNIVTSIKKVSDLNNEIAAASSEQTTGIQQISKAMNQLDQASQANAASAEEIAATSSEINNLAMTNLRLTVELNETIMGASNDAVPAEKAPKSETKAPKKNSNIITMRRPTKATPSPKVAAATIPFDDDARSNVGGTEGF